MDSLPVDITAQILAYLPGREVERSKQLASSIPAIARRYQRYLKPVEVSLRLENLDYGYRNIINVTLTISDRAEEDMTFSYDTETELFELPSEDKKVNDMFESMLGTHSARDLRSFFSSLFQKADVNLDVVYLYDEEVISTLAEVIKTTPTRIKETTVNIYCAAMIYANCDLLKAIADNTTRTEGFPALCMLMTVWGNIVASWGNLAIINREVAHRFPKAFLDYNPGSSHHFMIGFAKSLLAQPLEKINFCLRGSMEALAHRREYDFIDSIETRKFAIAKENPRRFHFFDESDLPSWIRFVHRTGNGVEFRRIPGQYKLSRKVTDDVYIGIDVITP